jgi:hypothetical protein
MYRPLEFGVVDFKGKCHLLSFFPSVFLSFFLSLIHLHATIYEYADVWELIKCTVFEKYFKGNKMLSLI